MITLERAYSSLVPFTSSVFRFVAVSVFLTGSNYAPDKVHAVAVQLVDVF